MLRYLPLGAHCAATLLLAAESAASPTVPSACLLAGSLPYPGLTATLGFAALPVAAAMPRRLCSAAFCRAACGRSGGLCHPGVVPSLALRMPCLSVVAGLRQL